MVHSLTSVARHIPGKRPKVAVKAGTAAKVVTFDTLFTGIVTRRILMS